MGDGSNKYSRFKKRVQLEKVLNRNMGGLPYYLYNENRVEIDNRRDLERQADRLLGKYKDGSVLNKREKRREDKRLIKLKLRDERKSKEEKI